MFDSSSLVVLSMYENNLNNPWKRASYHLFPTKPMKTLFWGITKKENKESLFPTQPLTPPISYWENSIASFPHKMQPHWTFAFVWTGFSVNHFKHRQLQEKI